MRSHYGFDSFFCLPGPEGAHEKGGVEGEVGRFRRRHLVPVPRVESLAELNELFAAADRADDERRIGRRTETVGDAFAVEAAALRPLPAEAFECFAELSCKVDTKARICVRQSFYSVPARLARRRVTVRLHANRLEVFSDGRVVATHARSLHKGSEDLVLDHYLEVLVRKPGALPGSVALAQARAAGVFTASSSTVLGSRPPQPRRRRRDPGVVQGAVVAPSPARRCRRRRDRGRHQRRVGRPRGGRHRSPRRGRSAPAGSGGAARCRSRRSSVPAPILDGYDGLLAAGGCS